MPPKSALALRYQYISVRKATFTSGVRIGNMKSLKYWPHDIPSAEEMANVGFYYTPSRVCGDQVTCFWCGKKEKNLGGTESISALHHSHSDRCPYAVAYHYLTMFKGDENIENFWNRIQNNSNVPLAVRDPHSEESISLRLSTFKGMWKFDSKSKKLKVSARGMASSGFFFAPIHPDDDRVICMYCGCPLSEWDEGDDPWKEHEDISREYRKSMKQPACYFLSSVNTGITPVDTSVDGSVGADTFDDTSAGSGENNSSRISGQMSPKTGTIPSNASSPLNRSAPDVLDTILSPSQSPEITPKVVPLVHENEGHPDLSIDQLSDFDLHANKHTKPSRRYPRRKRQTRYGSSVKEEPHVEEKSSFILEVRSENEHSNDEASKEMEHSSGTSAFQDASSSFLPPNSDEDEYAESQEVIESARKKPAVKIERKKPKSIFSDDEFGVDEHDIANIINSPRKDRKVKVLKTKQSAPLPVAIHDISDQNLGDYDEQNLSYIERDVKIDHVLSKEDVGHGDKGKKMDVTSSARPRRNRFVLDSSQTETLNEGGVRDIDAENSKKSLLHGINGAESGDLDGRTGSDYGEKEPEHVSKDVSKSEVKEDVFISEEIKSGIDLNIDIDKDIETDNHIDIENNIDIDKDIGIDDHIDIDKDLGVDTSIDTDKGINSHADTDKNDIDNEIEMDMGVKSSPRLKNSPHVNHSQNPSIIEYSSDDNISLGARSPEFEKSEPEIESELEKDSLKMLDKAETSSQRSSFEETKPESTLLSDKEYKIPTEILEEKLSKHSEEHEQSKSEKTFKLGEHITSEDIVSSTPDRSKRTFTEEQDSTAKRAKTLDIHDTNEKSLSGSHENNQSKTEIQFHDIERKVLEVPNLQISPNVSAMESIIESPEKDVVVSPSSYKEYAADFRRLADDFVAADEDSDIIFDDPPVRPEKSYTANSMGTLEANGLVDEEISTPVIDLGESLKMEKAAIVKPIVENPTVDNSLIETMAESKSPNLGAATKESFKASESENELPSHIADSMSEAQILLPMSTSPVDIQVTSEKVVPNYATMEDKEGSGYTSKPKSSNISKGLESMKERPTPEKFIPEDVIPEKSIPEGAIPERANTTNTEQPGAKTKENFEKQAQKSAIPEKTEKTANPSSSNFSMVPKHSSSNERLSFSSVHASTPMRRKQQNFTKPVHFSTDDALAELQKMDDAIEYLTDLAAKDLQLHNDTDGRVTNFIAAMPEEEEAMSIEKWIFHNAESCQRVVESEGERIIERFSAQFDQLIEYVASMETAD